MELWIEASIDEVVAAVQTGLVARVATNPSVIARWTADGRTLEEVVADVCRRVDVPVYVQLHGPDVSGYLSEMEALRRVSDQVRPKLVATPDGIAAARLLAQKGLEPLVTAVCTVNQAFLAAVSGASYIAPYFGRIEDAGEDAAGLIEAIADLYAMNEARTRIVAASVRTPQQAQASLLAGAHAVVVSYPVFQQLFDSPLTQTWIEGFEGDWDTFTFQGRADRQSEVAG